jgi:hypothetical protein
VPGTGTEEGKRPRPVRASKSAQVRVQSLLAMQAEQLEHLSQAEMVAVDGVLRQAKRETAAEVSGMIRQWPNDWSGRFDAQQARNAMAMGRRVQGRLAQLGIGDTVANALADQGLEAAGMSVSNLERELAVFGEIFDGSVHPISIDKAALIAEGSGLQIHKYRNSAARYQGQVLNDLKSQISIGLARGETFDGMTSRLARLGGPTGIVALRGARGEPGAVTEVISEGLFRRHRYVAERLIRTEGIHAYNEIHERALSAEARREVDDDDADGLETDLEDRLQKKWDATADRRLCPVCRELDGQVVEVDGLFYPLQIRHPGAHPNCRCTIVPWRLRWGHRVGAAVAARPIVDLAALAHRDPKPAKAPPKPKVDKAEVQRAKAQAKADREAAAQRAAAEAQEKARQEQIAIEQARAAEVARKAEHARLMAESKARQKALEEQTQIAKAEAARLRAETARIEKEKTDRDKADAARAAEYARGAAERATKATAAAAPPATSRADAKLLAGVASGTEQGLTMARESLIESMSAQGMVYNRGATTHRALINDEPTKVNATAFNGWDGVVVFAPDTVRRAGEFAKMWKRDEDGTRAAVAKILPRNPGGAVKINALMLEHDAVVAKFGALSPKARKQAIADHAKGLETPGAVIIKRREALERQITPLRDVLNADLKARHAQAPIRDAINGMRTVIHEEYHSFGPVGSATSWAYNGPGAVAEEVTTEVLARRHLATSFGVDRDALRNPHSGVGSYNKAITDTHAAVMQELGLDSAAAWDRLEAASARYKTHAPSDANPDPHQILAQELARGHADRYVEGRLSARLGTLRLSKDD